MTNLLFIPYFCFLQHFSTYKINLLSSAQQKTHFKLQNKDGPNSKIANKNQLDLQTKFAVILSSDNKIRKSHF
jgi:hypothetical protein